MDANKDTSNSLDPSQSHELVTSSRTKEAYRSQKALETLLAATDDFIYIKDKEHRFIFASDAFARLTQHESWRELVGKDDFDIFPEEHAKLYYEYEKPVMLLGEKLIMHEEPYYDSEGNLRWVTSTKNPFFDDDGNVLGLIGISKDITELKVQRDKIIDLATHDDLTGLLNRRAFFETGKLLIHNAIRNEQQVSLLYIDLDGFKQVNDSFGHDKGDEVLRFFSRYVDNIVREADLFARLGGDEFVILMTTDEHGDSSTLPLVHRIIQVMQEPQMRGCGCSIGVSYANDFIELTDLLKRSDVAMYQAKNDPSTSYVIEQK